MTPRYDSSRRAAAAAETKASILSAAKTLFLADGYAGTTVQQIARAAGVAVPTVYASAGSKAEILSALILPFTRAQPVEEAMEAVRAATNGAEVLALTCAGVRRMHEEHRDVVTVLFPQTESEPAAALVYRQVIESYQEGLGVTADRLLTLGGVRPGLDREGVLDFLWFYFGLAGWRSLCTDRGWTPERAEKWLTQAAAAAILE